MHMHDHNWGVIVGWHNMELFVALLWSRSQLCAERLTRWERVEPCRTLYVPTPPVLTYYSNVFIGDHPNPGVARRVAALESGALALICFLAAVEKGAVGYEFHDPWVDHGGCGVLAPSRAKYIVVSIITAWPPSSPLAF